MGISFTNTQKQRLTELDAENTHELIFDSVQEREAAFKKINQEMVERNKQLLNRLQNDTLRPAVRIMEAALVQSLNDAGFVEVTTPVMLSKGMLAKMGITSEHPLFDQVYWIDKSTCLRPMLAPNLYYMLGRLGKTWPRPIRIFEIGPCFRKDSKGAKHLTEFTMLNLVEMGTDENPEVRIGQLADMVMTTVRLNYSLEKECSEVYGDTVDVVVNGTEVASGATGPHALDINWNISENWVGLGFGLERLVMIKEGFKNIRRVGRSLIYLDGARLNI